VEEIGQRPASPCARVIHPLVPCHPGTAWRRFDGEGRRRRSSSRRRFVDNSLVSLSDVVIGAECFFRSAKGAFLTQVSQGRGGDESLALGQIRHEQTEKNLGGEPQTCCGVLRIGDAPGGIGNTTEKP